jgi:hypothetical protein
MVLSCVCVVCGHVKNDVFLIPYRQVPAVGMSLPVNLGWARSLLVPR